VNEVGFAHPTFSGRIGLRSNEMWAFGISGSAGPYLLSATAPTLPLGRSIGDYREIVLGQDVSFAWRHLQLWAEFYETRFEVPNVDNADIFAYYFEANTKSRRNFSPPCAGISNYLAPCPMKTRR
jgi:hypothetical protein